MTDLVFSPRIFRRRPPFERIGLGLLMMVALSLSTGALAAKSAPDNQEKGAETEPTWVEKVNPYYSIVLDDNLEPEVDAQVTPMWVTSVFLGAFCGSLWIPMVWVGEDPGSEYFFKEALIHIALEYLTYLVGAATTPVGGIGAILITANLVYFAPIGIINGYDRALKKQRGKPYPGSEDPSDGDGGDVARLPTQSVAMAY